MLHACNFDWGQQQQMRLKKASSLSRQFYCCHRCFLPKVLVPSMIVQQAHYYAEAAMKKFVVYN